MPNEPENALPTSGSNDRELCVTCVFPNEPGRNFCARCGAPITSYAATGPFESIFAEGHLYRQAAENPRRFIVVLGIWMIFGMTAVWGTTLLFESNWPNILIGFFLLAISIAIISRSTRNYLTRPIPQPNAAQ
jgi:hypothetical protein